MKFLLTCSSHFAYTNKQKEAYEALGFKLEKVDNPVNYITNKKQEVYFINKNNLPKISFNTLEELVDFAYKHTSIIVSKEMIEIYDDYRE